ncbi:uncharacterized protein THITE_2111862 [Thermothielavioides terrestris NRRL 8126]|uniref:EGF-like domain-containing protein n=1 Tax=Thermothielavioides terrestris (strain ATCC 38088 / NRRL 8126) TaxID=578455 RepID=G2R3P8_THETT|nr:uncharacterized protein THITE_2111862 [Thermothielavioides terrestris NRRL 8126]AEO65148.1 hypothetical protein THITE_2111862 [Thermothielavioides terrestris NRRL 8126]
MDRPMPGSVKRARERAAAGLPREAIPPQEPQMARPSAPRQPAARQQAPFALQTKDGQIGVPISRPIPAPQWPLQEPIIAPAQVDGESFRSPSGTSRPPQRPPRPSRVPSILDASKVQDHTPVFQYRPRSGRESAGQELLAVPETPSSSLSRPSTLSSVASIPDFPLPSSQLPSGPPRRSVNLGPPPSARRGASSFYSNASFVSPIPEESPRTRSHASFASSAAMPENWGSPSPGPSPDYPDPVYGEAISDEREDADDDTDRLVRSASLGKRAKPTLVSTAAPRGIDSKDGEQRSGPQPLQAPFRNGTGYLESSSSSATIPAVTQPAIGTAISADTMLGAYTSASADDPSDPSRGATPSPNPQVAGRPYSRLSAIRRPPRLDIDAVRKAEARGSLTSLPDLIRRATRLAASLEKGRRPASRFDDLEDLPDNRVDSDPEKRRSGLSDMLAAFPPPAHPPANQNQRSIRNSIREQIQSWPLPINVNRTPNTSQEAAANSDSQREDEKRRGRRCCGIPLWAFILIVIVVLILIAAAIVIPVEFFVVHKQNGKDNDPQAELQRCMQQLSCANGGTNVVNQGICSCICTNGFAGQDCTVNDKAGCTTISLTGSDNISNVTIGDAIPRLLQQAQANFSIPLSAGEILVKLNSGNLSCSAENALVTFNGRATRQAATVRQASTPDTVNAAVVDGVFFTTITVVVEPQTTFTLGGATTTAPPVGGGTSFTTSITSGFFATTFSLTRQSSGSTLSPTATRMVTTTMSMSSGAAMPTATGSSFVVSEDVLDFSRVAVLAILQADSLADAITAQMALQKFFGDSSSSTDASSSSGISVDAARNVTVGDGKSVDLVDFTVDLGGSKGKVGRLSSVAARAWIGGGVVRRWYCPSVILGWAETP